MFLYVSASVKFVQWDQDCLHFLQRNGGGDQGILEEFEGEGEEEPCYGKRCTANEHCCPGSVCVDVDGGECNSNKL